MNSFGVEGMLNVFWSRKLIIIVVVINIFTDEVLDIAGILIAF